MYNQNYIDKTRLTRHIRHALQDKDQISLRELVQLQPLEQGLAELVCYLQLGNEQFHVTVDEAHQEQICWQGLNRDGVLVEKFATLPIVIFVR